MAMLTSRDRDLRATLRTLLFTLSCVCIMIPLPLIGVMGYLVAGGKAMAAYQTALTAVGFCVVAIAAYLTKRAI